VCALELVRQEMPDRLGAWPFEIGLWVGKAATPNRMGRKGEKDKSHGAGKTIAYKNNSRKASPIPLETCPWCGTKFKPTSFTLAPNADEPRDLTALRVPRQLAAADRRRGRAALPAPLPVRPVVYYDPRSLDRSLDRRATWHAKVVVDDEVSLVTSANFTEWAQQRNLEAGALIRAPPRGSCVTSSRGWCSRMR
jgi:hypothetical protein